MDSLGGSADATAPAFGAGYAIAAAKQEIEDLMEISPRRPAASFARGWTCRARYALKIPHSVGAEGA